ncbi:hypothetical protein [Jonesia quinghaiensis]|uniref:hypothetical protein n=1 Tax=Jonesia quinghaiensis TaxID=262806 RepID=UPI00040CF985|nr:hypothetical protein [Jonesia quinghaiensis]
MYIAVSALSSTDELWVELDDYRYHLQDVNSWHLQDRLIEEQQPAINPPILMRKSASCRARKRADFLWGGGVGVHVVSQVFIDALVEFGATGWETYPIDLVNGLGQEIPGYIGFLEEIGGAGDVKSSDDGMRGAFSVDVTGDLYEFLRARKLRFKKHHSS